ncbi:probable RNA-binding protein 19 [Chelonus insularis]|uniref:probable RNA-binding protein 19 n=1 Tax=Chelonus insularis TaxID=460826 RepID=UPI00158D6A59|nr:probable RNA-binding protein 19 [Chelonus insularis]
MSRLVVKNLPPNIKEAKLKDLFSTQGVITDIQLKYTKDGKFRRFGFIGYKSEEDAKKALAYFDKSCIDTSRISVELCAELGDSSKPKSWSKYAPDSSAHVKLTPKAKTTEHSEVDVGKLDKTKKTKKKNQKDGEIKKILEKHKEDPLFTEFLESHAVNGAKELWGNDLMIDTDDEKDKKDLDEEKNDSKVEKEDNDLEEESNIKVTDEKISDLEYMEKLKGKGKDTDKKQSLEKKSTRGNIKLYTVVLRGLGYKHKKKHIKQFFHPLKPKSIRVPVKIKGIAYVGFKSERQRNQALNKDKGFFEGKRIFVYKYEGDHRDEKIENDSKDEKSNVRWKQQEEALKNEETIAESGRIFVRNLSYITTEDDLRNLFEKYGPLAEIDIPIDKVTRKSKGFGTITYMMPEHAMKAYSELDGKTLHGRMLHLLPGKAKSSITEAEQEGMSFKEKKEFERKKMANSTHNWNTLFLGQNAVVDAIASNYNTTKEKVLEDGGKGTSVAVRIALGETQLVEETRKFLEDNGVKLDAFNKPTEKRSKTVILVKNLPPATLAKELCEKFSPFGILGRVIMPPSGVTALVEFLEPSEARKAFNKLAYTKFKHLPLYLEWAPEHSLSPTTHSANKKLSSDDKLNENTPEEPSGVSQSTKNNESDKVKQDETSQNTVNEEDDEEEDEPEPDTTLFVKNLNFSTGDEGLKKHFSKCGQIHYAAVATKKDSKNPGQKLSMGYGFVRYKYKLDADRALKELQMSELDGKTLELKRSERTLGTDVATTRKISTSTVPAGTKILIKNIPFQANESEITELFKAFGQLKAVRLPKKLVGDEKHRGFGFVEYFTKSDAKKAFKSLCQSTHLYGRRLVLEWAQSVEDVDTIRKRTAKHFHQEISSKKSKKAVLDPESVGLEGET